MESFCLWFVFFPPYDNNHKCDILTGKLVAMCMLEREA